MKAKLSFLAGAACALLLAMPLAAANAPVKATIPNSADRTAWPPETLSGKITMVDPSQKLVVVQTSDGTPFDMMVTPKTRIESGNQAVSFQDLNGDMNKNVSVRFVPESRGDVARSINIGG
ncbi:MAG TPA: hypothetical protein VME43_05845 [Bryobacteraceae bacterium]|nr:hypothetical protein [Bryobacteraceae bacterium]